ncbi:MULTISPECIES: EscU/YscU/HrcU family type III secretion system export apparatus switch protein [Vallitalea]|uniref:EscU/YscU/HrcU family type III secretion system export apparatus switch protein n=2 Tax=Vallitalea TaxID=1348611 RepID=A0A8J8M6T3_9FIRM|nr:EscU/YscU/HrcU family type III secretion system export apparatus switch protein [Vallitalea guaymasensis]QUH27396.1 EscU/YscU/HrcU family type III secretion system export apparatus switch protein [Vallitalea guaymasensis]GMQ64757.1 EscU/YscU/HrcU family type III secretion system export apparatus switch protein [Vallitalea sp. AN17-2]
MDRRKIKKVAALKYDINETAPTVIAKGKGIVADKILEKADEQELPIYKDEKLVESLTKLDIGDMIPPELYQIVAEILVFVSDLDDIYKSI